MVIKDENQDKFRNDLFDFIAYKFNFELNSKEYLVAAVLDVGMIHNWKTRSFCVKYFQAGLDSIYDVLLEFSEKYAVNTINQANSEIDSIATDVNLLEDNSEGLKKMSLLTRPRIVSNDTDLTKQTLIKSIKNDVQFFKTLISNASFTSTKQFWLNNKINMPYLFKLAQRLLNIPATSACIERYFSISGIVASSDVPNISDNLIIKRSMLICIYFKSKI